MIFVRTNAQPNAADRAKVDYTFEKLTKDEKGTGEFITITTDSMNFGLFQRIELTKLN